MASLSRLTSLPYAGVLNSSFTIHNASNAAANQQQNQHDNLMTFKSGIYDMHELFNHLDMGGGEQGVEKDHSFSFEQ